MYNGILNAGGPSSAINSTCTTGNCTYTTQYASLGFCSSCQNITPTLRKSFANVTLIHPITGEVFSALQLNVSLPNGVSLLQGSILTSQPNPIMAVLAGTGIQGGFGDSAWLVPYQTPNSSSNQSLAVVTPAKYYDGSGVFVSARDQANKPFLGVWSISQTRDMACSKFLAAILHFRFAPLSACWAYTIQMSSQPRI